VQTFDRLRIAKPIMPKPTNNIAQVAGSGTADDVVRANRSLFSSLKLTPLKSMDKFPFKRAELATS
jgi:hypothetical protein